MERNFLIFIQTSDIYRNFCDVAMTKHNMRALQRQLKLLEMFAGNNLEYKSVKLRVKLGIEPEELPVPFPLMLLLNVHSFPLTGYNTT